MNRKFELEYGNARSCGVRAEPVFMVSLCGELTVGRRLVKKASQELNSEIKVMGFLGRY